MSKMSELSQVLDDMITCGEGLIKAANALREIFSETEHSKPSVPQSATDATVPAEEKGAAKTYTFAEVRKAFSAKSHKGYTAQIKALIGKYGAERLSDIKESDYPALMADLEVIE
jgi:hypothetical protein